MQGRGMPFNRSVSLLGFLEYANHGGSIGCSAALCGSKSAVATWHAGYVVYGRVYKRWLSFNVEENEHLASAEMGATAKG